MYTVCCLNKYGKNTYKSNTQCIIIYFAKETVANCSLCTFFLNIIDHTDDIFLHFICVYFGGLVKLKKKHACTCIRGAGFGILALEKM